MTKLNLLFLLLILSVEGLFAQSKTYHIEDLTKPEKLLPTVHASRLFDNVDKNFLKLSVSESLVDLGTRPVITGYLRAYQNHYPVTISPDIAWLLICQGFSHHINQNPEKLRSKFVNFEGKKMLTVQRDMKGTEGLAVFPWETVFPEFAQQIACYTGQKLIDNLSADFTTSTPTSVIAGQITIMESMKEFFNYKVIMMGCGIPDVTVEGTVKDWEKILTRLDYLADYELEWWTSELKPVIQKIIDTKKGKLDKDFWMNMVKYHKTGVYGSYDGIDGWLLKFYPYLEGGAPPMKAAAATAGSSEALVNFPVANTDDPGWKSRPIYLRRSDFKEIKSVGLLPKEIANVPFLFEVQSGDQKIVATYRMEFWAGFMGVKQDPKSFNVKPEIGWAVNKLN
ncbi:DUF4419 domain-containing protein [Pedobacter sp. GR22-6]|uniref:DUF4419 domain-containing protein n=1 Tax=Pedobacter sp. GR22-6 TaxID=3127957 RepID=UPI00307D0659